jgi:hypothetical protein
LTGRNVVVGCFILGAVLFAATILTLGVLGLLSAEVRIPGTGNVVAVNVGVYSNSACTNPLTTINWGSVGPGEEKQFTCYVKSLSNVPTTLTLGAANFNSTQASQYLSLSWNRQGYNVAPGEIVTATLTLHVDQAVQGLAGFSFDCIFTASGG